MLYGIMIHNNFLADDNYIHEARYDENGFAYMSIMRMKHIFRLPEEKLVAKLPRRGKLFGEWTYDNNVLSRSK